MTLNQLLVVDDDVDVALFVKDVAEREGFDVALAHNCEEFRQRFLEVAPSLVMIDLKMPGEDGIELMHFLADQGFRGKTAVVSGFDSRVLNTAARLARSYDLEIVGTLSKPMAVADLEALLAKSQQRHWAISEDDLRLALHNDDFSLHYQPKLLLGSEDPQAPGACVDSVEALLRWQHEALGSVPPEAFMPMAEDTGLIIPLSELALRKAMEQACRWQAEGLDIAVAVNLPAVVLCDGQLPARLSQALDDLGLPTSRLILEVSESGLAADEHQAMETLTRLRLAGFALSIDDFGTGYSSLVQLCRMPFSEMKIDRSLVAALAASAEAQVIVKSVIELARGLGMTTCAEGLEDEESARLLRVYGCDKAQGHLFSPALPEAAASDFLRDHLLKPFSDDDALSARPKVESPLARVAEPAILLAAPAKAATVATDAYSLFPEFN